MKWTFVLVLVAILAVTVVFTTGCSNESVSGSVPTAVVQPEPAEVSEPDLSSVEETYTWPPRLVEGDEEPLMAEVDAIMRDNWEALRDYKANERDPLSEYELYWSSSSMGIQDVMMTNLMVLAHNGYTDYVQRRINELEAYNKAFSEAGGEVPKEAIEEDIEDVKSYLK